MHLLVTGAAGFLGGACVRLAEQDGHRVSAITRAEADLADPAEVMRVAELAGQADATIHVAAKADFTCPDTHVFTRPNVVATALLAEACAAHDRGFVYASAAVIAPGEEITANSPDAPASGYIRSKWLGEQAALALYPGAAALRLGGIYGRGGPAHLGLNRAIDAALDQGEAPIIFGDGSPRRNYLHVDDAARALLAAAEQGWHGRHLIAGHEVLTVAEIMTLVATILAGTVPRRAPDKPSGATMVVRPSPAQPASRPLARVLAGMAA